MTRVDFYISENNSQQARMKLACRIAEKAYDQKQQVYLHVADQKQAEDIDKMLWTFNQGSFIPHSCCDDPMMKNASILIGWQDAPEQSSDVLINLIDEVPGFFSRYDRVAEVDHSEEQTRQKARERYKFYKDRGYPLQSHTIKS